MMKISKDFIRKAGIILIVTACTLLVVVLGMAPGKETEDENIGMEIPDAQIRDKGISRIEIFRGQEADRPKRPGIEDLYAELEKDSAAEDSSAKGTAEDRILGETEIMERPKRVAKKPRPDASSYYETPQEREERHRRAMEQGLKMSSTEFPGTKDGTCAKPDTSSCNRDKATAIGNNIPSGAAAGWESTGVSTLSSQPSISADTPVRCMFVRTEKIVDGKRVAIRLLDDLVLEGGVIHKNTHLMAVCSIGTRLELKVSGIEAGGRIMTVSCDAYDMDGIKGIYCPDIESNTRQTARNGGAGIVQNQLSSRIGRVANDILSTGVSVFRSKSGERSVTVPAGYEFYLLKNKRS